MISAHVDHPTSIRQLDFIPVRHAFKAMRKAFAELRGRAAATGLLEAWYYFTPSRLQQRSGCYPVTLHVAEDVEPLAGSHPSNSFKRSADAHRTNLKWIDFAYPISVDPQILAESDQAEIDSKQLVRPATPLPLIQPPTATTHHFKCILRKQALMQKRHDTMIWLYASKTRLHNILVLSPDTDV